MNWTRPAFRTGTRRGSVAIMVAVLLTVLMATVAISVDGGMLMAQRRQVQSTADAAAMAAACVMYENYPIYLQTGNFPVSAARKAAQDVALANGIDYNAANTQFTVNVPPQSGPYSDPTKFPGPREPLRHRRTPEGEQVIRSRPAPTASPWGPSYRTSPMAIRLPSSRPVREMAACITWPVAASPPMGPTW
jgi:hypothetical protein